MLGSSELREANSRAGRWRLATCEATGQCSHPRTLRGALHVTAEEPGVQGQWQDCLQDSLGKCSLHGDDCLLLLVSVFSSQRCLMIRKQVWWLLLRLLDACLFFNKLHGKPIPFCGILFASIYKNPICLLAFTGHSGHYFKKFLDGWMALWLLAAMPSWFCCLSFWVVLTWTVGVFRHRVLCLLDICSLLAGFTYGPLAFCVKMVNQRGNRFSLFSRRNLAILSLILPSSGWQLMLCRQLEYRLHF